MDQLDQDLTRFKNPAMAAVGGIAAALVIATLPPVYLENIIGLTGISEFISAAAPPLGNTAKALISITAGLVTTSALVIYLNRKGGSDMGLAIRANLTPGEASTGEDDKSRFNLPKFSLKKLLQKPARKGDGEGQKAKVMDLSDLPKLREADSHPDAPARKPIFAESDLGTPLAAQIKPFAEPAKEESKAATPEVTPASFVADKSLQMPVEEEAFDLSHNIFAKTEEQPVQPVVQESAPVVQESAPVVDPVAIAPKEDMSGLSIAQLAERLETGLEKLKQLEFAHRTGVVPVQTAVSAHTGEQIAGSINAETAEAPLNVPPLKPVEQTGEDMQTARQADMDAALKAALSTLEKMTAQR